MCTSIIETARAEGMAKRGDEWFPLTRAVVAYDHARHAPLGDVITLDFINTALAPGARAAVELSLETAKELRAALDRAIAAAELEEAEVRGKVPLVWRPSPDVTVRPGGGVASWAAAYLAPWGYVGGRHVECPHYGRVGAAGIIVTLAWLLHWQGKARRTVG